MKVVFDIEANSLTKPTKIWVIVCKDVDTGQYYTFREVTQEEDEKQRFLRFTRGVDCWIGHNILEYDYPVLHSLIGFTLEDPAAKCLDTLILSRMLNYPRGKHSIESYGEEFGLEKVKFNDFTQWSDELERYCVRDVDIAHLVYLKYLGDISDPSSHSSIDLEHRFQLVVNSLHNNGFCFDTRKADALLSRIGREVKELDEQILSEFPPKLVFTRKLRRKLDGDVHPVDLRMMEQGKLLLEGESLFSRIEFNPASHKQIVEVLNTAGWKPVDKTQTHIDTERLLKKSLDKDLQDKLEHLKIHGWKVNEENLATLPSNSPKPARLLAKRILLESRRRTLVEWLGLVQEDGRIHGKFVGIGAWTHRMAHQRPNTANIPNDKDTQGKTKLYGGEFRSLWIAPKNRLLLGVDAEGIQLRIFAHYIDDKEFTDALVRGRKDNKSDPHSLNQRIIGSVCKDRQAAKRFIYALLLGAGLWKLSKILECSELDTRKALDRLLERYEGFETLKSTKIPRDATNGFFTGLDGRKVLIPGVDIGEKKHLAMSGYLQNGEAVVMKRATLKWHEKLKAIGLACWLLVNLVHDEWQTEVPNNVEVAKQIAQIQSDSLREVGEELKLKCPMAGSYWNDERKDYTIGTNWKVTH